MFGTLTLALAITVTDPRVTDPRPELVELQLAGKPQEALGRVEQELAQSPDAAHRLGLDVLRGHLLDRLGRQGEASEAFVRAMAATPPLSLYSRYRLAMDHDHMGHPEIAAGLISYVTAGNPGSPLIPEAVRLFVHVLFEGGDCRLLGGLHPERLPVPQRRQIQLVQGECALRGGYPEMARSLMVGLLEESRDDECARRAAERLSGLVAEAERGRLSMLLGSTFHQHKDYDRALPHLQRAGRKSESLSARDAYETQALIGQVLLGQRRYAEASVAFSVLGSLARTPGEKARALYHEARAHELRGAWPAAAARYRQAWQADTQGRDWAAPSLLGALRLEWRNGAEASALKLYRELVTRPEWRNLTVRASLFLAASDLARGRRDRARSWLEQAAQTGRDDRDGRIEISYWFGRLAELEHDPREAVSRYLEVLRADPYHPLARAARTRLAAEPLSRAAAAEGRRLAGSSRLDNVYGGWLLLGTNDPAGRAAAQHRMEQMLLADRATAPYLKLEVVSVRRWPMWSHELTGPEEMLLALGILHEGAPAVPRHFPLSDPNLAYTGSWLLARGGEVAGSISLAESLRERTPGRLPLAMQSQDYRRLLYPILFREHILAQGKIRGVDPHLLTALLREESRFDRSLLSPAAVAVSAAQLGAHLKAFANAPVPSLAAHQAGDPQALVWKGWCFTAEPDEYYTKIGSREARDYVGRVLESQGQYAELY
ncbi:MAG: soluble lytic murein transglycosylase [Acidobacteriota bacterium]|jgi:tetratricopeptide (TPR) repeat protein|nr:soluble lytic murein transglycosylase [Acidobacteriota bacterium]